MEPLVSRRSFHNPFFIAGLSGVEIVQQVPPSYNREGFVVATQIGSENSYFRHKWQRCSRSNTYEKQPGLLPKHLKQVQIVIFMILKVF